MAHALCVLAGPGLVCVQTVAFVQEPLQSGALDGFGLTQWRHLGRGLCLTRRNLRGMLGAFRNRGRGECQRFGGILRQAFEIAPAQQEQKSLGLVDQTR